MNYRVISADCHIDMIWTPGDLWVKNAPAKFRDQVPQVRETPSGPHPTTPALRPVPGIEVRFGDDPRVVARGLSVAAIGAFGLPPTA
jgi:hypothetical protein